MIVDSAGWAGSGFEHVPGGAQWANQSAFSFHYYCDTFVPGYGGKPVLTRLVCDRTARRAHR
jgi:hypothetical protein